RTPGRRQWVPGTIPAPCRPVGQKPSTYLGRKATDAKERYMRLFPTRRVTPSQTNLLVISRPGSGVDPHPMGTSLRTARYQVIILCFFGIRKTRTFHADEGRLVPLLVIVASRGRGWRSRQHGDLYARIAVEQERRNGITLADVPLDRRHGCLS